MTEAEIQNQIRLALGRIPGLVIWRNSAGVADVGGRKQRFGLVRGATDLVGVLSVNERGYAVFIEVKTPSGRLSPEQKLFGELVTRLGCVYGVARSPEDALAIITTARDRLGNPEHLTQ